MTITGSPKLKDFWESKPEHIAVKGPLEAWKKETEHANWKNPGELKQQYRNASILKKGRVVFNIAGNKYRLVVQINYSIGVVSIRFIGTHKEYNKINAQEV